MSRPPYVLTLPERQTTAAIFASPHSGREYPWEFIRQSRLDEVAIRSSEDAYVDRLFDMAPEHGAPFLTTVVPRAYVDLNRAADELDPALIAGVTGTRSNPRIAAGLGVIPRVVAGGRAIRDGKIGIDEARARLNRYYHPYHARLSRLVEETRARFGHAILFDCHSMPHEALVSTAYAYREKPQIVLGDRFGAACAPRITRAVTEAFEDAGLRVSLNVPFAGAFVTQKYGRPAEGLHAIQIEIDRALYLDEEQVRPAAGFMAFRKLLGGVVARLAALGREDLELAAE